MTQASNLARLLNSSGKVATGNQPAGTVLQVVRAEHWTQVGTSSSSSWTNIGQASITPSSSNSRILILGNYQVSGCGALRVSRNGTPLSNYPQNYHLWSYGMSQVQSGWASNSDRQYASINLVDSPSTTGSTTYTVDMIAYPFGGGQGIGVNECAYGTPFSGLTLMEIAG